MPVMSVKNLTKIYRMGDHEVRALRGVTLDIERRRVRRGDGPVGLRQVDVHAHRRAASTARRAAQYFLDGKDVSKLSKDELARVRNQKIGFVFQGFNLLSRTTALDNVELPLLYRSQSTASRRPSGTSARSRCSTPSAWASAITTCRTSCRAASSSAWRSRARSSTSRRSCWPTSRPATSTRGPASRSWASSSA